MKKIFVLIVLLTLVMAVPVAAEKYTFYMTFEWAASEDPSCFIPNADKVMAISYEDAVDFTEKLMNHYRSGGSLIRNVRVVGQEPDRSIYVAVGYLETEKYKLLKRENPPAPDSDDAKEESEEQQNAQEKDPNSFEALFQKYRNEVTEEDIMNTMSEEKKREYLRLKRILELRDFTETIQGNIELYRLDRLRKEGIARVEAAKKEAKERADFEETLERMIATENAEAKLAKKKVVETEKRYCAHIRAEFDNDVIQVDIWAYSDNQARCMIEAVMESLPAGDGGYDLFYGSCIDPSGDKIYIDNYPSCKEL